MKVTDYFLYHFFETPNLIFFFNSSTVDVQYYISNRCITVIHNFKGYIPFIVTIKCWLYSPCSTVHPWSLFMNVLYNNLYLLIPYCLLPLPHPLSPLITTSLFSVSESVSFWLYSLVCFIF